MKRQTKTQNDQLKPFSYFCPRLRGGGLARGCGGPGLDPSATPLAAGRLLLLLLLLRAVVQDHQLHLTAHSDRVVGLLKLEKKRSRR